MGNVSAMKLAIYRLAIAAALMGLFGGVPAFAGPGDGVKVGALVLSPYIELVGAYDSNVYKDSDEVDDLFFEPELGLRFSLSSNTNLISMRGNLFFSDRAYSEEHNRDFQTYGDSLGLRLGNEKTLVDLIQSYRYVDDYDRHATDIESSQLAGVMIEDSNALDMERELHQVGALVSRRMTDKLELGLSYRYSGVDYENDSDGRSGPEAAATSEGLDLDGHAVQLDGALKLTDKTAATLALSQGWQYQDGIDDAAQTTVGRLGLRSQGTDKLVYHAGVGVERFERPEATGDASEVTFNFHAAVDWFITEKLTFRCGGLNGSQWSAFYGGNGLTYASAWAGLGYRFKPSAIFSMRGVYRMDDYLDPVTHEGVTKDRRDNRMEGHARIDYIAPGDFLRVYLEAIYDKVESNFDFVEYDEKRVVVGVNVRY